LYNEGNTKVISAFVDYINYNEKYYNNIKNADIWLKNPKTVVAGFTGTLTRKYYLETFDDNALNSYKKIFNVDTFE